MRSSGSTQWEAGLTESTYPSKDFSGSAQTATPRDINNYKQEWWGPEDKTPRSIRYSGSFKAAKAGKYLVLAAASGSDHYTVSVDGKQIIEQEQIEGQHPESASIELSAGQTINVVADYLPGFVGNRFGLGIVNESDMISTEVKHFASIADVVIRRGWIQSVNGKRRLGSYLHSAVGTGRIDRSFGCGQSAHRGDFHRRRCFRYAPLAR